MENPVLELQNIRKYFDDVEVLKGINLTVAAGEFVTLLGSSGCGKTTTLRIIAGLENADSGRVFLEGEDVTTVEANHRNVNTVFQSYALFPHMNVFDNIGYGLRIKKVDKKEIKERVQEMLRLVQLEGFELRMPAEMSGGQRQRVAIARALINRPKVLLLDEPLGALDLQLRRQMQLELKRLQKRLGITFIYITHDQEEAINMSDRIVVMRDGEFEQIGRPDEIYNRPRTSFVADFVGNANILHGKVKAVDKEKLTIAHESGEFVLLDAQKKWTVGEKITVAIRGENIKISSENQPNSLEGEVVEKSFAGGMLRIEVKLRDESHVVISRQGIDIGYKIGEKVHLYWQEELAIAVDVEVRA